MLDLMLARKITARNGVIDAERRYGGMRENHLRSVDIPEMMIVLVSALSAGGGRDRKIQLCFRLIFFVEDLVETH